MISKFRIRTADKQSYFLHPTIPAQQIVHASCITIYSGRKAHILSDKSIACTQVSQSIDNDLVD